ncbi:MAG: PD-(D/E)XK nuclease family protein [Ignavibacteriae bacterium]|nr:PD-(D/E)XK nuclease family protein [Ignavibacteriota bacterium]
MKEFGVLSPGQDLIAEIINRLPAGEQNFSNDLIVFPGKRPAHWLRRRLAEKVGKSFIPPRVYSIETFIEYLHDTILRIDKSKLSDLDAAAMLFDVHREFSQRVGQESYTSLETFFPLGAKLFNELEKVMLAEVPGRRLREELNAVQFQKFHSLAAYYEAFYDALEQRGYSSRAMMYRAVADRMMNIDWTAYRTIVLAGFHTFTNTEKRIVAHLRDQDNTVLLFQNGVGLQRQLQSIGLVLEEEPEQPAAPEFEFVKAQDLHGQVFALAARLKEQSETVGSIDEWTAVVLPSSEALFPTLHFALSLLPEGSYNIALQYPLSRTPVFGFLNTAMDFVASAQNGRYSAAAYLKFVLHPYTKNIRFGQSAEVTRMMFHALEDHIARHYAKALISLEELEGDGKLFEVIERRLRGAGEQASKDELSAHLVAIHGHTVRKLESFSTVQELAACTMEVLEYIAAHSTANLHPYFRPYAQKMMELLDGVRTSMLAGHTLTDTQAAFAFLRKYLSAETMPFSGTPLKGMQVLGLLETRNLQFDTLYILDATDDIVPGKPGQDMLLPQPLRTRLGLETSRDAERLSEYYFTLAVRSAKRVVVLYSESNDREKSRFVQKFLWQLQQQEGKLEAGEYEQHVKYRAHLANERPGLMTKTEEVTNALRSAPFSAHALDTYRACQLRFYYQYVLRLAEREEITDELEATDVGKLVHAILKEYFEPLIGKQLKQNDFDRNRLEQVVQACFENTFGKEITGAVQLLRRQVMRQLEQVLEQHQVPLAAREALTVQSTEQKVQVEYKGYQFTGVIDRIEKRGEKIYIVDYKTDADEKSFVIRLDKLDSRDPATWRAAVPTFQLALYMLLYSRATNAKLSSLEPVYLFLGKNAIDEKIEYGIGGGEATAEDVFAAVEPLMMETIGEILNPAIPFTPTPELEKECPRCPFNTICGTQWVQGWGGG